MKTGAFSAPGVKTYKKKFSKKKNHKKVIKKNLKKKFFFQSFLFFVLFLIFLLFLFFLLSFFSFLTKAHLSSLLSNFILKFFTIFQHSYELNFFWMPL